MENLRSMPDIDVQKYIKMADKYIKKYVPDMSDFCIWDTYYAYKPSTTIKELVPPFKGRHIHVQKRNLLLKMLFYHEFKYCIALYYRNLCFV